MTAACGDKWRTEKPGDLDLVRILRNRPSSDGMVDMSALERDWLCDEVDRLRAENAALKAQQCPHRSKTFGQCIVCGWTGRPACSECGEPVRPDWECCSACGAWENALEAER